MSKQPKSQTACRLLQIVTHSMGVNSMLKGQLRFLREAGFEVTVASSPGKDLLETARADGVEPIEIPMQREIAPLSDLRSLWRLWRLMRRIRPAIVHVGTPKAGLLGGLAAFLAGVPHRFYTLHGLRFETEAGVRRRLLAFTERLSCRLADQVICVSKSLRSQAVAAGVVERRKTVLLGPGSANGVDADRFALTPQFQAQTECIREFLGIETGAPVIGFVGRLTRDKGIAELVSAHALLKRRFSELRLVLVGAFESGDPLPRHTRQMIEKDLSVVHTGFVPDPAPYYHLMDLLVLPSYREGLPTVALEAAAAGKPVIAARVTGACEAVLDGETGLLVAAGDVPALAEAIEKILNDRSLARRMGQAGRRRVRQCFAPRFIWQSLLDLYRQALNAPQPQQAAHGDAAAKPVTAVFPTR